MSPRHLCDDGKYKQANLPKAANPKIRQTGLLALFSCCCSHFVKQRQRKYFANSDQNNRTPFVRFNCAPIPVIKTNQIPFCSSDIGWRIKLDLHLYQSHKVAIKHSSFIIRALYPAFKLVLMKILQVRHWSYRSICMDAMSSQINLKEEKSLFSW